jgi:hypothetical protein
MLTSCPVCLAVVALLLMDKQLMKQLLADPAYPPNKPVQMPNGTIYIPLHVAIMAGNTAAEKLLLEAGAAPTTSGVYTLGNTDSRICSSRRSMCWCRSLEVAISSSGDHVMAHRGACRNAAALGCSTVDRCTEQEGHQQQSRIRAVTDATLFKY